MLSQLRFLYCLRQTKVQYPTLDTSLLVACTFSASTMVSVPNDPLTIDCGDGKSMNLCRPLARCQRDSLMLHLYRMLHGTVPEESRAEEMQYVMVDVLDLDGYRFRHTLGEVCDAIDDYFIDRTRSDFCVGDVLYLRGLSEENN